MNTTLEYVIYFIEVLFELLHTHTDAGKKPPHHHHHQYIHSEPEEVCVYNMSVCIQTFS